MVNNRTLASVNNGTLSIHHVGGQYTGEKVPGELAKMVTFSYDPNRWNSLHFTSLAQFCATLYYTSELARASVNKPLSYIIGPGLKFRSALNAKYMGLEESQARDFSEELTYKLDEFKRDLGYYKISADVSRECLITGDAFIHILRNQDGFIDSLAPVSGVVAIANDKTDYSKRLINGVYTGYDYKPYAFHDPMTDKMIPFSDDFVNMVFVRRTERVQQVRGTGIFYFAISRIKNYDRIWEATLEKMIMESVIVGYADSGGEVTEKLVKQAQSKSKIESVDPTGKQTNLNPGLFLDLQNKNQMKFLPPGTPSGNFGIANEWVLNLIGAGCGYPSQFLLGKYDTAYSASKAALNDVERQLRIDRSLFINEMEQPINEILLEDLLRRGEIILPREGLPLRRWLRGYFTHPRLGHINPLQEAKAQEITTRRGWQKQSDIAEEYGLDYNDNMAEGVEQLKAWEDKIGN